MRSDFKLLEEANSKLNLMSYRLKSQLGESPVDLISCRRMVNDILGSQSDYCKYDGRASKEYNRRVSDYVRNRRRNEQLGELFVPRAMKPRREEPCSHYWLSAISKLNVHQLPSNRSFHESASSRKLDSVYLPKTDLSKLQDGSRRAVSTEVGDWLSRPCSLLGPRIDLIFSSSKATPAKELVIPAAHQLHNRMRPTIFRLEKPASASQVPSPRKPQQKPKTKTTKQSPTKRSKPQEKLKPSFPRPAAHFTFDSEERTVTAPLPEAQPVSSQKPVIGNYNSTVSSKNLKDSADTAKVKEELRKHKELQRLEQSTSQDFSQAIASSELQVKPHYSWESPTAVERPLSRPLFESEAPAAASTQQPNLRERLAKKRKQLKRLGLQNPTRASLDLVRHMKRVVSTSPKLLKDAPRQPTKRAARKPATTTKASITDKLHKLHRNRFKHPIKNLMKAFDN